MRIQSLLLFLAGLLLFSCGKENQHPVPEVNVNFVLNLSTTQHIELNTIGGWAYYTGGYKGIVIYRQSVDEFRAFDRACPYHPFEACARVQVFEPPLATDTCCGSTFLLLDGSVVTGPSQWPLKQYRTYLDGNYLYVSN